MKNNTKLIMETWRRFLSESPSEMSDFDRETQGPDSYVPDELLIDEILDYLRMYPDVSDDELKEMFGAYDEDIEAARARQGDSAMSTQSDEEEAVEDMPRTYDPEDGLPSGSPLEADPDMMSGMSDMGGMDDMDDM